MIEFIAFTPHTPLLLPTIGKEHTEKLEKTKTAFDSLQGRLIASNPDTIVLITSHEISHNDRFTINLADPYTINLKEFGHHEHQQYFHPDTKLIDGIQRSMRRAGFEYKLDTAPLDHASAIPLILLTSQLPKVKIVPLIVSGQDAKTHIELGRLLKDELMNTSSRIAIIASGDLSHCLTSDAPNGYCKAGEEFDAAIIESMRQMKSSTILGMKPELIKEASECAYTPIMTLFGIIERMNLRPEILSYEHPFGVGYLTTQFHKP